MKEQILQKLGLTERGAFNILKDATLCDRILTEDVIWILDFCKKYDVSKHSIQNAIKNNYISHFSNTEQKGGKVFIFEKEVLDFFPLHYHSNFIYKNAMFIFNIYFEAVKRTISERESEIVHEIIILKEPLQKISEKHNISTQGIYNILQKSQRRLMYLPRFDGFDFSKNRYITQWEIELATLKNKEKELLREISFLKGETKNPISEKVQPKNPILEKRLVDIEHLSVRALNSLRAHDIETIEDLISFNKHQILSFRCLGKKTLKEVEEFLKEMNFELNTKTQTYEYNNCNIN